MLRIFFKILCVSFLWQPSNGYAKRFEEYSSYEANILKIIQECRSSIKIYTDELNDPEISNALIIAANIRNVGVELFIEDSITLNTHIAEFRSFGIDMYSWSNFKAKLHLIYCGSKSFKFDHSLAKNSYAMQNLNLDRLKKRHLKLLEKYTKTNFKKMDVISNSENPESPSVFQTDTLQTDRPEGVTSSLPTKPKYLQHKK